MKFFRINMSFITFVTKKLFLLNKLNEFELIDKYFLKVAQLSEILDVLLIISTYNFIRSFGLPFHFPYSQVGDSVSSPFYCKRQCPVFLPSISSPYGVHSVDCLFQKVVFCQNQVTVKCSSICIDVSYYLFLFTDLSCWLLIMSLK